MTFHELVNRCMESNGWDMAYAAGYVAGRDDAEHDRRSEHKLTDTDDYAMGYHKGYAQGTHLCTCGRAARRMRHNTSMPMCEDCIAESNAVPDAFVLIPTLP